MDADHHRREAGCAGYSRWPWFLVAFAGLTVLLLWQEHRAHLLGVIPYLILLACPLLHLFMHRGHGRKHSHGVDHHA
jgi:hypothetical protein